MKQIILLIPLVFSLVQATAQTIDTVNHLQYVDITPLKVSYSDTVITSRMYLYIEHGNAISSSEIGYMDFTYLLMDNNQHQTAMGIIRLSGGDYINFLQAFCTGDKMYVFNLIATKLRLTLKN